MAVQIERNNLIDGGVFYVEKNNAINYVPLVIVEISGALEVVQFDPPTNIRETGDSESSVTWEWTAAKHATEYQYQTRLGALGSWSAESIVAGTSVTVTSLASDSSYDIRIRSKNGTLLGEWSSPVSGTTDVDIPPPVTDPVTPSTPRETADSSDSITWTWSSHSENTGGHEWGLRTGSGNAFRSSNQSSNRLKTGDLTPTSTYQLRVRGLRHGRRSAWSAWGTGTTGAVDSTPAPTLQPDTPPDTTPPVTQLVLNSSTSVGYDLRNPSGLVYCNVVCRVAVTGGVRPYRYSWSGHTFQAYLVRTSAIYRGLLGASFRVSVTVTDSDGSIVSFVFSGKFPSSAPYQYQGITVPIVLSLSISYSIQSGSPVVTMIATPSRGFRPFTISYSGGNIQDGQASTGKTGESWDISVVVTDNEGQSVTGNRNGIFP